MKRLSLLLLLFAPFFALASTTDSVKKPKLPAMSAPATITDVYNYTDTTAKSAGISDVITVRVVNLDSLFKGSVLRMGKLRLFLNSMEIVDAEPIGWSTKGNSTELKFPLMRTDSSKKAWNELLGYPEPGKTFFCLPVTVSVGLHGDGPIAIADNIGPFNFIRIYRNWFWGCVIFLVAYFCLLFWCAIKTPMLRDAPADLSPLGIPGVTAGCAPFSLGKVQMAFWFSIVLASYIFIWVITDNYETITSGTLVLIGIGAATGLGAVSIGNNKADGTIAQIKDLQKQQSDLRQANQLLEAANIPGNAAKIQYNEFLDGQLTANINDLLASLKIEKDNFFNDLLTDVNGVSFHRLQMVVFTVVLGMVFIYSVWATLTMPDFSGTLLTMQGITAGTYLGFKLPEKQGASPTPTTPPTQPPPPQAAPVIQPGNPQ